MSLLNRKEFSLQPLLMVLNVVLLLIVSLISVITFGKINIIASSRTPNFVELLDGSTRRVQPVPPEMRSPQVIGAFVGRIMVALMSWNSLLQTDNNPNLKPQLDEGVQIADGRVTTRTWSAAFALSQDFRTQFLSELAKLTPSEVFTGKVQSILLVQHLSQPQNIAKGKWKLDLVASLVMFESGKQVGQAIAFNKTIFLRTIDTPLLPEEATELQKTAYQARKDCLEIYLIQELVQS